MTSIDNSMPSIPRGLLSLCTQINQLQTDLYHLLSAPPYLDREHLPLLLYNHSNLIKWLHATPTSQLCPLLQLVEMLLLLPQEACTIIDIDITPAPYVAKWVISRHNAAITTAPTAGLIPLDTLPSFVLKTLIKDINEGICPQVPWKNWNIRRLTPLTTPSPMLRSSSPDKLQYNPLSPVYQPETPTMPALLLLPLSALPLASPLPRDPPTIPSTLPTAQYTPCLEAKTTTAFQQLPLPPIIILDKALPISAHLLNSMQPSDLKRQSLTTAISNLILMMSPYTTL
jgi:hypothetical protein